MREIQKNSFDVVMDDGTEYVVFADQRDFAAWEGADIDAGPHTMIRYYAWNAMRRNGQYGNTFDQFNTKDCAQVGTTLTDEEEAGLDPTKKDSSRSTPGRKNR